MVDALDLGSVEQSVGVASPLGHDTQRSPDEII